MLCNKDQSHLTITRDAHAIYRQTEKWLSFSNYNDKTRSCDIDHTWYFIRYTDQNCSIAFIFVYYKSKINFTAYRMILVYWRIQFGSDRRSIIPVMLSFRCFTVLISVSGKIKTQTMDVTWGNLTDPFYL